MALRFVTLLARLYEHCADLAYFGLYSGRVSLFAFLVVPPELTDH